MVNGIDYNGKQGRHPNNCDCIKHVNINPMPINKGAKTVVDNNQPNIDLANIDPAILGLLSQLVQGNQTAVNPNNQVPVPQTPQIEIKNEYIIPLSDPTHKANGFSTFADARNLPRTFDINTDDFRIVKVYGNPNIVGKDQWELVLRRKA